jgi:DNA gyrase subunit A
MANVYKMRLCDIPDSKVSLIGEYLPNLLSMEAGEQILFAFPAGDYKGNLMFVYENGKMSKVPLNAYETKTNRKKLTNAFFGGSPLVAAFKVKDNVEYLIRSNDDRVLLIKGAQVIKKSTKTSSGSTLYTLKKGKKIISVTEYNPEVTKLVKESKYRKSKLPASGVVFEDSDPDVTQQTFLD